MTEKQSWQLTETPLPGAVDDYVYSRNGVEIGRVYLESQGPQVGHWRWSGLWAGLDNRGVCETREQALAALRERAPGDEAFAYRERTRTRRG